MEISDDRRVRLCKIVILISLIITGLATSIIKAKEVNENNFSTITAIPSPLFVGTQVYGTYMVVNNEIKEYEQIDYDFMADRIILCESGGDNNAKGDWNGKEYLANGVAQFHLATFNLFKKLANKPNLEYNNADDQKWLLKWALVNGYESHWTCYNKIYN
jgi:hypothetical protein